MKKAALTTIAIVIAFVLFTSVKWITTFNTGTATTGFDEYGVWEAISSQSVASNQWVSVGPSSVSRLNKEINYHIYGVAANSLEANVDVYGMMSYSKADTSKAVKIASFSGYDKDSTITYADTLEASSDYPYIWIRLKNPGTNATASTITLWVHARPIEKTVIQKR